MVPTLTSFCRGKRFIWRFPAALYTNAGDDPTAKASAGRDLDKIAALANTRCSICDGFGHTGVINKKGKTAFGRCPTETRLKHYLGGSPEAKAAFAAAVKTTKTSRNMIFALGKRRPGAGIGQGPNGRITGNFDHAKYLRDMNLLVTSLGRQPRFWETYDEAGDATHNLAMEYLWKTDCNW